MEQNLSLLFSCDAVNENFHTTSAKPSCVECVTAWPDSLSQVMEDVGVDTQKFGQHATRSASALFHKTERSMSVKQICQVADWSQTSGVFKMFYDRYLN